ncbi:hypothetical protein [Streptomyces sp. NPDC086182]|uniref:hypothetical protein n=1 Tax=Streptomyces sp. NPDC086182 TaxID=3155058 RepID=UPI00342287E9
MRLSGSGAGTLDVWVPGPSPQATGSGLTGIRLAKQPDGWRLTAHTSRRYTLHMA